LWVTLAEAARRNSKPDAHGPRWALLSFTGKCVNLASWSPPSPGKRN
jgi:hypothetical protein